MTQNDIEKCQVEISKSKSLETDKLMVYAYNDTFFNPSEPRDLPPYSILILVEIIINIFECKSIRSKLNWRVCHMTVSHDSGGVSSSCSCFVIRLWLNNHVTCPFLSTKSWVQYDSIRFRSQTEESASWQCSSMTSLTLF